MISEADLANRLAALLSGELSLDDFEDWFTVASWNAHKDSSQSALRLMGAVELRLGEYSSGHLSFQELSQELEAIVKSEPVQVSFSLVTTVPVSLFLDVSPHHISRRFSVTSLSVKPKYRVVPVPVSA